MYIYIDESGTFVHSPDRNSWCVVAAYVIPEHLKKRVDALVHQIRHIGNNGSETKLKNLSEEQYMMFLSELQKIDGLAFSVAVDMGLHDLAAVERHKVEQADKIVEHRDKMLFETAKEGLTELSQKIRAMPVQLYTQLVCQLHLFHKIIRVATLYYVQRHPPTLGNFRWCLDRKAKDPTVYESAFRQVLPAILQTKSLEDPMIMLKGEDYSHFERFCYSDEDRPTYLQTCYGIQSTKDDAIDIGKIVRENFKLVDSASCPGVLRAE